MGQSYEIDPPTIGGSLKEYLVAKFGLELLNTDAYAEAFTARMRELQLILIVQDRHMLLRGKLWLDIVRLADDYKWKIEIEGNEETTVNHLVNMLKLHEHMDQETAETTVDLLFKDGFFIHNR